MSSLINLNISYILDDPQLCFKYSNKIVSNINIALLTLVGLFVNCPTINC